MSNPTEAGQPESPWSAGADAARPIKVGIIGAGKFATMFLSQALRLPSIHVLGVADLSIDRACQSLDRAGWPRQRIARSFDQARQEQTTYLTEDSEQLIAQDDLEVVIEATGNPAAGIRHAMAAIEHAKHIVMVNVEADVLAGALLARAAAEAGVVYSLAYGDQPALICELVEWARTCGLDVVCAGKGTKYLPHYHQSTPDTVWQHYGFSDETVAKGDFNPRMFNSFLDGTKSAIEMAAVANATGLTAATGGLGFPPAGADDLPSVCKPRSDGGQLAHAGTVEVVSSLHRDGTPVAKDLRWGVYVTFTAPSDYARRCFGEYGLVTDDSGRYASMYRPYHLIGLELAVSVLRVARRREPTGCPVAFVSDVVATAKRDLAAGETLDGEGGHRVYGKLCPADESVAQDLLPIGLAHDVKLKRNISTDQPLSWSDVDYNEDDPVVQIRKKATSLVHSSGAACRAG
jgi:predicted homoserine dehydrogenase-like protein